MNEQINFKNDEYSAENWQNILGHEQIKSDLQHLLAKRKIPHALLFTGIDGIGKLLTARVLAKSLLCEHEYTGDSGHLPCGHCRSCKSFDQRNHPDFYCLKPDGKTLKMIKIEQVRQMQSAISLAPYLSDKRVVIIDGAEYMNEVAANSLLKTLEEPVGQVFFILISSNKDMLLNTILSRCMKIYFAPLQEIEVTQVLTKKFTIDETKARLIAKLSGGSASKAIEFIDDNSLAIRDKAIAFFSMTRKDLTAETIWKLSDELSDIDKNFQNNKNDTAEKNAKEYVLQWANYLKMAVRDTLLLSHDSNLDSSLLYNSDIIDVLNKQANSCTRLQLFNKLNLLDILCQRLHSNADLKLLLQDFMLRWQKVT